MTNKETLDVKEAPSTETNREEIEKALKASNKRLEDIADERKKLLDLKAKEEGKKNKDKEVLDNLNKQLEDQEKKRKEEIRKKNEKHDKMLEEMEVRRQNRNKMAKKAWENFTSFFSGKIKGKTPAEQAAIDKSLKKGPDNEKISKLLSEISNKEAQIDTLKNNKGAVDQAKIKELEDSVVVAINQANALADKQGIVIPELKDKILAMESESKKMAELNALKEKIEKEMKEDETRTIANFETNSKIEQQQQKILFYQEQIAKGNLSPEKIEGINAKITAEKAKIDEEIKAEEKRMAAEKAKAEAEKKSRELIKYDESIEDAKNRALIKYKEEQPLIDLTNEKSNIIVNKEGKLEKTITNTPESKKQLEDYTKICKYRGMGNIVEQAAAIVPGFNELPDGQKMLVMQGMNDELLNYINEKATAKFNEKMESKKDKKGILWAKERAMMWTGMRKNYLISKFRQEELEKIKGNKNESAVARMDFINAKVPGLVKVFGESGVNGYLDKDGINVIADFANIKNLEGATPSVQKSAEKFNKLANKLSHIPQENKKAYEKAEKEFKQARNEYLVVLEKFESEKGNESSKYMTAEYMMQAETLMRSMSFLAADPKTAEKLESIAMDPVFMQTFNSIASERGLMMAGGMGARKFIVYSMLGGVAISAAPITGMTMLAISATLGVSAGISYLTGKKRAEKGIEEQNKAARRGEKQKGNMAIGMGNVTRHLDRIEALRKELNKEGLTEVKKKEIMSQLRTVADFVSAKMARREINFGKDAPGTPVDKKVFVVQNRLMNELLGAYSDMEVETNSDKYVNIFDSKAAGGELVGDIREGIDGKEHNIRRLIHVHGARNVAAAEKARNEHIEHQAKRSAKFGMLFAGAGMALAEAADYFGWHIPGFGHHPGANASGVTKPQGWHSPMVLPNNQNVPIGPGWDPLHQNTPGGLDNHIHGGAGHGGHHGAPHHGGHHGAPHHGKPNLENPQGSTIPSENEVGNFPFTKSQFDGISQHINQLLKDKINSLDPEMTQIFKGTPADDFLDWTPGELNNPQALKLFNEMMDLQKMLGTHPKPGESIEHYYAHMLEYRARADILIQIKNGGNPFPSAEHAPEAVTKIVPRGHDIDLRQPGVDTHAQNEMITKLADEAHTKHLEHFFKHHQNWLHKHANHLINRDENGVWNPTKRELDQYMYEFAKRTGIFPEKGETIDHYMKVIEEYNAREDVLNNVPDPDLGPVASPADHNYVPESTGAGYGNVPPETNAQDVAHNAIVQSAPVHTGVLENSAADLLHIIKGAEGSFQLGNSLVNTHMSTLDHVTNNDLFQAHITELAHNSDLQETASENLTKFISEHGLKTWDGIRDIDVRTFANMNVTDDKARVFHELVQLMQKGDPQVFKNSGSVEDFLSKVYFKDEIIRYSLKNYAPSSVNVTR